MRFSPRSPSLREATTSRSAAGETAEAGEVRRVQALEDASQLVTGGAKYGEPPTDDHAGEVPLKLFRERPQVGDRGGGVGVSLVDPDRLAVLIEALGS